ncbi:YlbG family protein [Vagococcus sp.]|uniref:YlbG family protein n=1 Tax=Vagococcus sp. TaxID=1933889 RepID=UPI003F9B5189
MFDEETELEIIKRRGMIVWIYSLKQIKQLRRFGYIHYISKKMKYVLLYVDDEDSELVKEKLEKLFFVRQVDFSYRPDIDMDFNDRLGKKYRSVEEEEPFEFDEDNTSIKLAEFDEII